MTYLPSLIKKIDDFYNLTKSFANLNKSAQQSWSMPDDPEEEEETTPPEEDGNLYSNIMNVANSLSNDANDHQNEDVANELVLIGELYKKALEINGGYNQLIKAISTALANIDSMIDDSDGVIGEDVRDAAEDVLEETASDLRRRSKASIGSQADETAAMNALRAVKQQFNTQEARQEMEGQKSVYEKGKPGEESGHGISARAPLETPEKYAREMKRLEDSLPSESDVAQKKDMEELGRTLARLIKQMTEVTRLQDLLKITPEDKQTQQELIAAEKYLIDLRTQRRILKTKLNEVLLKKEQLDLANQFNKTRNPEEQKWLKEKIDLLGLQLNRKILRKRDEIQARKVKINSMGVVDEHGDFQSLTIPEEQRIALNKAIEQGKQQTISKTEYDRSLTEQRGKGQGREDVPNLPSDQRGGWRPIVQKDFSRFTFPALAKELRDRNNTAIDSARRYMTNEKEGGKSMLKDSVKAVSDAIRKKDNAAKYAAILNLKNKIKETFKLQEPAFQSYRRSIKLLPIFKRIEESVYGIIPWQNDDGIWAPKNMEFIQNIISDIDKLEDQYAKYYQSKGRPAFSYDISPRFDAVLKFLPKISKYLEQNVLKNKDHEQEIVSKQASIFEIYAQDTDPNQLNLKKKEYDRARTEQRGLEQGREDVPYLPSNQRGGWRPIVQKDFSKFTFPAMIKELRDKINTAIDTSRKDIHSIKANGHPALKLYIDAVSNAIRKKDNAAKYIAITNLKKIIEDSFNEQNNAFQSYRRSIKLVPIFRKLENNLTEMKDWQDANGKWQLKNIILVQDTISSMKKLSEQYAKYYSVTGQSKLDNIKPHFDGALKFFPQISQYLEQNVLQNNVGEINDK